MELGDEVPSAFEGAPAAQDHVPRHHPLSGDHPEGADRGTKASMELGRHSPPHGGRQLGKSAVPWAELAPGWSRI